MRPKIKYKKLHARDNPEIKNLAAMVGHFIQYWGFKAVQGQMWLYLYVSEQPLSSRELADLLEISPALVTQSLQVLLKYRVIFAAEKRANGVRSFYANANVTEAVAGVLEAREFVMLKKVETACESAMRPSSQKSVKIDPERVAKITEWTQLALSLLQAGVQELKQPNNPFDLGSRNEDA